MFCKSKKLPR